MVMDIVVGIIFVGAVILSMRKGFALTVINFIRVIASIVVGALFCDDVKAWILEKTGLGLWMEEKLQELAEKEVEYTEALQREWEAAHPTQPEQPSGGGSVDAPVSDGGWVGGALALGLVVLVVAGVGVAVTMGVGVGSGRASMSSCSTCRTWLSSAFTASSVLPP